MANRPAARLIRSTDEDLLLSTLEKPETQFGKDAMAKRDEVLEQSLTLAWIDMQKLGGNEPAQWQWGKLHHAFFPHPLANATDAATQARLNWQFWGTGAAIWNINCRMNCCRQPGLRQKLVVV